MSERIHKVLADVGIGSRRAIERWIAAGRITVDGRIAHLGDQLHGRERVCLDGRPIRLGRRAAARQFLAYYTPGAGRPREPLTERDRDVASGAPSDLIDVPRPKSGRWIDVAPLDPGASGLLVLTTDGGLAQRLMRPGANIEREYAVRLQRPLSDGQVHDLTTGVALEDGIVKVDSVLAGRGSGQNLWYHVVLRDSRHRKLRAALAGVGASVGRVIRVRFGPVELGTLRRGMSRPLVPAEVTALYEAAGLPPDTPSEGAKSGQRVASGRAKRAHRSSRPGGRPKRRGYAT